MNRQLLEKPFQTELVRTRRTAEGKDLSFVSAVHYVRRLNDAFDSKWTWKILSHEVHGSHVVVQGVLEAEGQAKHAFGGWTITVDNGTGEVASTADDLKAASTDALKKAASLFGVGLDLYGRDDEKTEADRDDAGSDQAMASSGQGDGGDRHRVTAKQLKAIFAIARIKGISDAELRQKCIRTYGAAPDFLTKVDASTLIDSLKAA